MVALLLLGLQNATQNPPTQQPTPQPCYDGAADFANAIQLASKADPKYLDTIRPFGEAYWMGRLQGLISFHGSYFTHEVLVCGTMIKLWNPALGTNVREFALNSIVNNADTVAPSVLQSDVQLAYVALVTKYDKAGGMDAALFDAGAKLAATDPHLLFAEFIELGKFKEKAIPDFAACSQFAVDHPKAPQELRDKLGAIAAKAAVKPFSVLTVREIGLLHAETLALMVPDKFRWKIPPDKATGG